MKWPWATYFLVRVVSPNQKEETEPHYLVLKRNSSERFCPDKLDPLLGFAGEFSDVILPSPLHLVPPKTMIRHFAFSHEDDQVRVKGELYEIELTEPFDQLDMKQESERVSMQVMPLSELRRRIEKEPETFMQDSCHAMRLFFQKTLDVRVKRRLLSGTSSGDLDNYQLRPPLEVIFFDCDDCLYFDGWKTAKQLTKKIDDWCVEEHGLETGHAYKLYKKYGTALKGLLAEGYLDPSRIDEFLKAVHDVEFHFERDSKLRDIIKSMDPTIPKYIFTASVKHHAERCLEQLGIHDLFVDIIDCKACNLETKHSLHSFKTAMRIAGVNNPEACLFLDDNRNNLAAARKIGWRGVLVGRVGRDCGTTIDSEHAELAVDAIHDIANVLPELFGQVHLK